ncbi:MAG: hypothetical protein OZ913_04175 [Ignavibacteriaceae bacterium]|nr:MAG: hypothetical protein EDM69_00690 [Chlorobiota bacterium]MBV6398811.1 hypothetical protein [Ignavibacteria bacterium]MCC6885017.1 hypothetical protein [Ignavibacteriales bacterium]MCE7952192.1 hypothetical protein [Chlorobi bacterium CHB7]MDL1886251.1 hypothetical protein [Ignavibacteria bacterium CHB1]MEB2329478.1 hypothetical protein [Ignavibacteriaceae bacterium]RIK49408.1 MAG: hypothetical protein DCC60_03675 [Ignavibacteriota bacterium]
MITKIKIFALFAILLSITIVACKGDSTTGENQSDSDTSANLSKEELFADVMVNDFLKEDDVELQEYLQTEIFPLTVNSERIYIEQLSTNEYLITMLEGDTKKNIIITKYFDSLNDQIFFERSEVIQETDAIEDQ